MSKTTKILFFDVQEYEKAFINENIPASCEYLLVEEPLLPSTDIPSEFIDADVVSVFTSSRVTKEVIDKFENLKMITTRSTGFSHIDIEHSASKNISVVNVPRYGDCTVAEYTFGLLLDVARKITLSNQNLQKGILNVHHYVGVDLFGKTIGVIGTGAIGAHVVKIANGFGMKILAFDPYPKQELVEKYSIEYVSLEELIKNSDIISIHAPSTKENFHMIDKEAFGKMKKGVIIVNTARGEIINTEALYWALNEKIVAGAGLDVVECEEILGHEEDYIPKIDCVRSECLAKTLINHKMLAMPNVIITPHVAFDTKEAIERILKTTVDNINGFLNDSIINKVN